MVSRLITVAAYVCVLTQAGATLAADGPVQKALSAQEQADQAFYQALRKSDPYSTGAVRAARLATVAPTRARVFQATEEAMIERLKKFGVTLLPPNSSIKEDFGEDKPMASDQEMDDFLIPPKSRPPQRAAGLGEPRPTGVRQGGPAVGTSGGSVPAARPAEPETVLDGNGIPKYLEFSGNKKKK